MNPNSLEMSPVSQGALLLFEDGSSNSSFSNNSNGSRGAPGTSRIVYNSPNRAPLPKYLEGYYSELAQADRAVSAKCNECGTVVKGSLGVTSNFLRHLRQRHPFIEVQNPGRPYPSPNDHVIMVDYHQPSISSSGNNILTSSTPVINPSSLMQEIQVFSHPRQRTQAEATLKWLTTDALPLTLVEERGFQDFCKSLDPTYTKVTRRTLNRMLVGTVSNEILPSIKNALCQVEDGNVHLTVDVWGPRHKDTGVFAIRTYYINDQWELRNHTLGYAAIESEREETENLLPTCAATLGQFGIDLNKVGTITTGNAWKTLNASYCNMTGALQDSKRRENEETSPGGGSSSASNGVTRTQTSGEEFLTAAATSDLVGGEGGESEEQREKHLPGGAEIRICKTEVASDDYDARDTYEDPLSSEFECLQAEHLPSVIDALHRVAQKAIDSSPISKRIMSELMNILEYAGRDIRWRDELIEHLPRKFRVPLKRSWNSKIDLLQWYAEEEVFNAVISCLSNAWNEQVHSGSLRENPPPNLPSQESFYDCRAIYTHLFSPLSEAVDTLQTEGTLASLVIPAMCGIVQAIWTVKERDELKRFSGMANSVIQGIDYGRCKNIREHDVFILATILDPRFKLTAFPDECAVIRLHDLPNREEAIKILREAYDSVEFPNCQAVVSVIPSPNGSTSQVDTSGAQGLANKKIFSFYIDRPIKKPRQETEVESYLAEDANPTYNPLSYWKLKENTWPKLATMAKKVLSIPTGQGSPKRLLTSAKDILNAQRHQIDLETMENMILYREHVT